jgi:positive regulator of sigma E activity
MSIKTSFHNSIFSAYKDLATFGPMERAMYERYTDIQNGQKNKEDLEEKKSLSFMSLLFIFFLFFLLVVFILGYYGINPLFFMYN